MKDKKIVVLISFNDRICLSTRILSSILKNSGHQPYLIFFKDDRSKEVDDFNKDAKYYQYLFNDKIIGCLGDINPPSSNEFKLLVDTVCKINPDVIGVSARSAALDLSKDVIGQLRNVLPQTRYIGGGYGPTLEPEKFLKFLDYICIGEGEKVISELVSSSDPKKVNNVAWLENGSLRYNPLSDPVDLNKSVYPDWKSDSKFLIEDETIRPIDQCYDIKTYDIFTTRGCPNLCTYCMASHWSYIYKPYGKENMPKIRLRSPDSVLEELTEAKQNNNISYIYFKDSIFGFNKKWLFEFMDLYDRYIRLPFICFLEINFTDEEIIKKLKASGLKRTTVGIQSANFKVRKEIMGRNSSDDQIVEYANMLARNGIGIHYDIMHWNPFDTPETLRDGNKFLKRLPKGEDVVVSQTQIFPRSRLDVLCQQKKPKGLSYKEYEYYAWIYQMILFSKKTENLADFVEKYECFKHNPRILQNLFSEEITKKKSGYKIIATREIQKGEMVTSTMIGRFSAPSDHGVPWDEKHKILTKVARRKIVKNSLIEWNNFFGTYENKFESVMSDSP